ncbi:MAG: hypothetical protein DWQ37_17755 [Planctomycetota bacterium]|nr:MAG: hypothetical protein DWQ37_17755 [Planctomycetota bacterium]
MFTWADFWGGFVLPGMVTGGLLLAGWRGTRRRWSARESRSWAGPLAVAAGFAAGYLALLGWPGFPPLDAVDWPLFLALPLAPLGLLDARWRLDLPVRVLLLLAAVATAIVLIAWPLLSAEGASEGIGWRVVVATLVSMIFLVPLDVMAVRAWAGRYAAIALAAAAPAAAVLMLSGSAKLGFAGGVLAVTQLAAWMAYVIQGRAAFARGCVLVFGTLMASLLWSASLYAELWTFDALLLGLAPQMAWLRYAIPLRAGWFARSIAPVLLVLAVACVPVVRLWWTQPADDPYEGYGESAAVQIER